jgi:hypothetical protein
MLTNTQTKPSTELARRAEPPAVRPIESSSIKWQRMDGGTQMEMAEFLSNTEIIPKEYRKKPGNIYVAAEMGTAHGWGPIQAMQNIAVVHGTPQLYAEAMRALVIMAGHKFQVHERTATSCRVTIERSDGLSSADVTYTIQEATQAGDVAKNPNYKTRPQRMLFARATSIAVGDACPELKLGMAVEGDIDVGGADAFGSPVEALQATTEAVAAIEAPEPVKKVSKPAEPPQAADEPEDAEIVPDEPTQATLDSADDNSDSLSADEWRALLKERGLNLGDIADAAKELGFESGVSYAKLGMLEPESCGRLLEALPAGNGAPFA